MARKLLGRFKNFCVGCNNFWRSCKNLCFELEARQNKEIRFIYYIYSGPGSVFGIATGYGLDGPGIESRWGARFSAPVQTGPGSHPASCIMGTGSFPGVKNGRGVTLTPTPF